MKVYKCLISGDELFSEIHQPEDKGGFYVVKAKFITRKADDVDDSAIGGNPSAEEEQEGNENGSVSGINVVMDHRLVETGFGTKKEYTTYMKDYMKKILQLLSEDKVEKFKTETQASFKEACNKFKDLQFYLGESQNMEGHIALVEWIDEVPYFYFYKYGVREEKY